MLTRVFNVAGLLAEVADCKAHLLGFAVLV